MEHLATMSWRSLRVACAFGHFALILAPACGGNASDPHEGSAGSAGSGARSGSGNSGFGAVARAGSSGVAAQPSAVRCGSKSCGGLQIPILEIPVAACCADEATNHCGLDTSGLASFGPMFAEPCQPLAQPGTADATCPSAAAPVDLPGGGTLPLQFGGCCRANHTCGYQLDTIGGAFPLGLGCVDATPFLAGEAPQPCGEEGAAGAGGAFTGTAGAGGDSSDPGAGMGGESAAAGSSG